MLSPTETMQMVSQGYSRSAEGFTYRSQAALSFWRVYSTGLRRRRWAFLTHRQTHLKNLQDVLKNGRLVASHDLGVISVPLDLIRGTESRSCDFDNQFNPLRPSVQERWINIASAIHQGESMPAVELIQAGDTYYVRDGHHRISVARAHSQAAIDAHVIRWQLD